MCPTWGLNPQPRYVPWSRIEPITFWCMGWAPTDWATPPGQYNATFNLTVSLFHLVVYDACVCMCVVCRAVSDHISLGGGTTAFLLVWLEQAAHHAALRMSSPGAAYQFPGCANAHAFLHLHHLFVTDTVKQPCLVSVCILFSALCL